MNHEENFARIGKEVADLKLKLDELRKLQREERKVEALKNRKKRGRKLLDEKLIVEAKRLAQTKPLFDVALRLGISRTTLYNKGISRKAMDAEKTRSENAEKLQKTP